MLPSARVDGVHGGTIFTVDEEEVVDDEHRWKESEDCKRWSPKLNLHGRRAKGNKVVGEGERGDGGGMGRREGSQAEAAGRPNLPTSEEIEEGRGPRVLSGKRRGLNCKNNLATRITGQRE